MIAAPVSPSTPTPWLRGNLRPVAGMAAMLIAGNLALVAVVAVAQAEPVWWWVAAAVAVLSVAVATTVAATARRPRLERVGDRLRVRLAPGRAEDVPLEMVECFFMGSQLIGPAADDAPRYRVGTLVMRIAERARSWQTRPTLAAWGDWKDGAVVFDGRWCEPLSVELARRLSGWLVEAKRQVTTATATETTP